MKNIYLVGFMGTGKSVVGKLIAKRLKIKFLDLDSSIEEKQGKAIKDIFAKKGEAYFRQLEKEAVKRLSNQGSLVVSCGGGVVLDKDNLDMLKNTGTLICLTARPEVILKRCKSNTDRPLLNVGEPLKRVKELLIIREPFYKQAHFSIDTSDLTVEQVVGKIILLLNNQ